MRHGKKFNHLSRKKGHRRAMLSNMAGSLIQHKRIQTTLAKAKALRQYLEPLVTKSKSNTTHSRRVVFAYLQNKHAVQELFDNIAPKVAERPGGYLRIVRVGFRQGDGAELALIEFVDFNETYVTDKKGKDGDKKKRRTRRGGKKKAEENAAATPPVEVAEDQGAEEEIVAQAVEVEEVEDTVAEAVETAAEEESQEPAAEEDAGGEETSEEEGAGEEDEKPEGSNA